MESSGFSWLISSCCRPLSERERLASKYLTHKDHPHTLKAYFRSALLNQVIIKLSTCLKRRRASYSLNSPACIGHYSGSSTHFLSLTLTPVRCKPYHLHAQDAHGGVQGVPGTHAGHVGTGLTVREFGFQTFSRRNNSGYLKELIGKHDRSHSSQKHWWNEVRKDRDQGKFWGSRWQN